MKSKIAIALFSIASITGFTNEGNQTHYSIDIKSPKVPATKSSFGYIAMSVADPDLTTVQTVPGIALGYRYGLPESAIDVSANYAREAQTADHETFSYRVPVSYLRYVSSDTASESFYYGAGLGWAGNQKEGIYRNGIDANATVGYEMYRTQNIHSFVQLDVTQAALDVSSTALTFPKLFEPRAQFAVGFGF